jgi:hypothetical protein
MNNSLLYKYLEEKYNDESLRNKVLYHKEYEKDITVSDLYLLVNQYIKDYKNNQGINDYLLVQNDIDTIARLIALLELGYSPILLNGDIYYIKKTIHQRMITSKMIESGAARDKYEIIGIDHEKLDHKLEEIKNGKIINTPGKGKIGIFSSGTLSEPKLVYLDEETIINNIKKSKIKEHRSIYNHLPLSSISGLFTNIFLPICNNNVDANLIERVNYFDAPNCTDLFLPRNYRELMKTIKNENVQRVFIFGETNGMDVINYLKPSNDRKISFINVYGSTEAGGLVSEYDITNAQEIFIYEYDLEKDLVIYSYDKIHFYLKDKNNIKEINKDDIKNINNYISLLPCGTNESDIKIDNNNIGEGIINDYHTGDIFILIDNKLYILGRKADLIDNTSLSYLDNETTNLLNKKCTAFTKDNEIYLAVKYDLKYEEYRDKNGYFRRLIKIKDILTKKIKDKYPMIKEVLFIPNELFPLSNTLKKSKRKDFNSLLDYYDKIRYRLDNYEEVLTNYIKKMCSYYLDFVPQFTLNDEYSIVIPFNQINEKQLIKLLEPLRVIAIEKKDDIKSYIIYYNDSYFFGIEDRVKYTEKRLKEYEELVDHNLFLNKLLADNSSSTLGVISHTMEPSHLLYELTYMFAAVGETKRGFTIIYPYSITNNYNPRHLKEAYKESKEKIKKVFKGIEYQFVVFPVFIDRLWVIDGTYFEPIYINPQGIIIGDERQKIIANSYLYYKIPNLKQHLDEKFKENRRYGKYLTKKYG